MDSDSRGKLIIKKLIFVRVARQGFVGVEVEVQGVGVEVEVQGVGTVGAARDHPVPVLYSTMYSRTGTLLSR